MEQFIEFVQTWGYWAVLLGAMIEGESVILTACVMAQLGYLSIFNIVVIAFLGTLFADQGLYYVGRWYGKAFLERFPKFKEPADKAFRLLHQWDSWFILIFRFIYGIRIISPVVIGTAGVLPGRFIPLNIVAAVIWTAISCSVGYLLGAVIEKIGFEVVEKSMLGISLTLLVLLTICVYVGWKKLSRVPKSISLNSKESMDDGRSNDLPRL